MSTHKRFPNFSPPEPRNGYIGHRGLAGFAPENTLASFQFAADKGLNWVEFDLRLTSDHTLVIFHDDALDRTTNGRGKLYENDIETLKSLDAGSWFDPKYAGETIPVFKEILPKLLSLDLYLNIELKLEAEADLATQQAFIDAVIHTLKTSWPATHPLPLISSFNWDLLAPIRSAFPSLPLGFLTEEISQKTVPLLAQSSNCALHCPLELASPELIQLTKSYNLPLLIYTVNEPKICNKLLSDGVFGVFTDTAEPL